MDWLLIVFLNNIEGPPKYFVKPYPTEIQCRYEGAQIDVAERLKNNYGVWFTCIERSK